MDATGDRVDKPTADGSGSTATQGKKAGQSVVLIIFFINTITILLNQYQNTAFFTS